MLQAELLLRGGKDVRAETTRLQLFQQYIGKSWDMTKRNGSVLNR
jgi:hypothetical protein